MFYHVLSCSRQANRDRKRAQCKLVKPLGLTNIWLHSSSPGQLNLKIQRTMGVPCLPLMTGDARIIRDPTKTIQNS